MPSAEKCGTSIVWMRHTSGPSPAGVETWSFAYRSGHTIICSSTWIPVSLENWPIRSPMTFPSAPVSPFQKLIVGFAPCAAAMRRTGSRTVAAPIATVVPRNRRRVIPTGRWLITILPRINAVI